MFLTNTVATGEFDGINQEMIFIIGQTVYFFGSGHFISKII